jgi:hypothetical protein
MASVKARGGFDHVIVSATLHGHGETDQKYRKCNTESGQQCTGLITPEISPSQRNHGLTIP